MSSAPPDKPPIVVLEGPGAGELVLLLQRGGYQGHIICSSFPPPTGPWQSFHVEKSTLAPKPEDS